MQVGPIVSRVARRWPLIVVENKFSVYTTLGLLNRPAATTLAFSELASTSGSRGIYAKSFTRIHSILPGWKTPSLPPERSQSAHGQSLHHH